MLDLNQPDTALLNDPKNRESRALDYAITALQWFYWSKNEDNPNLVTVDQYFMDAIETVLSYFDKETNLSAADAAVRLNQQLANWRRDIDVTLHPLSQLGRVLQGNPGGNLEYPGPVFLITLNEIFEGIVHEFVAPEWQFEDTRSANTFIALAAIALSEIAITSYWVLRANGTHLKTELSRLFDSGNRDALVGQLGNLVLAGQVCSWDCRVDFIQEGNDPTPEWSVSSGNSQVLVECTSYKRLAAEVNDAANIRNAIVTAWNAKRVKFADGGVPGVISTDISGLFVSREFGTLFSSNLWKRLDITTPAGHSRHIGVYQLDQDWELLQQESQNREMLGVISSALYTQEAQQRNIRGIIAYQGQQVVVDLVNSTLRIPKRGFIVWRGDLDDPDLAKILVALHQPAIPCQIPLGKPAPLSIFLV